MKRHLSPVVRKITMLFAKKIIYGQICGQIFALFTICVTVIYIQKLTRIFRFIINVKYVLVQGSKGIRQWPIN